MANWKERAAQMFEAATNNTTVWIVIGFDSDADDRIAVFGLFNDFDAARACSKHYGESQTQMIPLFMNEVQSTFTPEN